MATEIERKFLVKNNSFLLKAAMAPIKIYQGYLSTDPTKTIRIRITEWPGKEPFAELTIKGIGNDSGTSRKEWEVLIPIEDALEMINLCDNEIIKKKRYLLREKRSMFEVDVFEGSLAGLVIAEIELDSEDQEIERPSWLGKEVTGQIKYYNSFLAEHPTTDHGRTS